MNVIDKALQSCDASATISQDEIKQVFSLLSNALMNSANEKKWTNYIEQAQSKLLSISSRLK